MKSFPFPSLSKNAQGERNVRQACLNGIAEAQPLFCKERFIFISFILGRLENKRPALLHGGGGAGRNEWGELLFRSNSGKFFHKLI